MYLNTEGVFCNMENLLNVLLYLSMLFATSVIIFLLINNYMASIKTKQKIENLLIDFADKRGYESSYCPSEIARAFKPESWRAYMDLVREIADNLVVWRKDL